MASILASRLAKLEAKFPASKKPWRAVTVVAGEGQDAEVERLLRQKASIRRPKTSSSFAWLSCRPDRNHIRSHLTS